MRAALAVLLLLTALLSGCADGGKGGDGDATSSSTTTSGIPVPTGSGTSSSSTSATGTTGPASNRAPTASLEARINGTSVRFNMTGTDLDGDALTWTLVLGDGNQTNGTALPANATHVYKAGNYTANLTVSDGKASATANVTLNITSAAAVAGQTFAGDWDATNGHCLGASSTTVPSAAWFPAPSKGVTFQSFAVDAATIGRPYVATFTGFTDGTAGLTFVDAAGVYLARLLTADATLTIAGNVPAGAATAYFFGCLGEPDPWSVSYATS